MRREWFRVFDESLERAYVRTCWEMESEGREMADASEGIESAVVFRSMYYSYIQDGASVPSEAVATNLSTSRGTACQPKAPPLESDITRVFKRLM